MARALNLKRGKVYRTKDFAQWTANPTRLAKRLVSEGVLTQLGPGLYVSPERSKFGPTPPTDHELMRGFLEDSPFVFTGPDKWNALGLGSTAVFAMPLVYNTKRSGVFTLGGRPYRLCRVRFPKKPTPEWYTVDLLENHDSVGASLDTLGDGLARALQEKRLHRKALVDAASEYGTRQTRHLVDAVVEQTH
ncbi:MAG: hypothetical protein M3Y59_10980 [Myxococcota bacterium]|nr:hypothetical protein [Myxococcota bacterium]